MEMFSVLFDAYLNGKAVELINGLANVWFAYLLFSRRFDKITAQLTELTGVVEKLTRTIASVENTHHTRLSALESDVDEIKKKVIP